MVAWMLKNGICDTVEKCVAKGQALVDCGLLHHVPDEHIFENKFLFYRFYADEEKVKILSLSGPST